MSEMIEYIEVLDTVLRYASGPLREETVPLSDALGRVLSRDVGSDMDMPPFNKSAMDGFAIRAGDVADTPVSLQVVMDVPAGSMPKGTIKSGQAASIMTGAPVPKGADAVVMVEWTSGFGGDTVTVERPVNKGANVSFHGEIVKKGDVVLRTGTPIGAEELGLLAMVGADPVWVHDLPRAAVLATGDELVPAGEMPGPGQIRNSNGPAIFGFLKSLGLEPVDLGRVSDDIDATREAIEAGLKYDVLIVTGGVSVGSYDFVEDVLRELDIKVHLNKIAVKPGKPTVFGTRGSSMVFGLPGNPVSCTVISRVLVEPALNKRKGLIHPGPRKVRARLLQDIRKKPDRLWFLYGMVALTEEFTVTPIPNLGSADVPYSTKGNSLIEAPKGVSLIKAGEMVDVVVWEKSL